MPTFSINISEQDSQGKWVHLFRVTDLPDIQTARRVKAIIQNTAGTFRIEISKHVTAYSVEVE